MVSADSGVYDFIQTARCAKDLAHSLPLRRHEVEASRSNVSVVALLVNRS